MYGTAMIVLFGTANSAKAAGFKGNLNAAYKGSGEFVV